MRRLIIITAAVLLAAASCSSLKHADRIIVNGSADLTGYSEDGFLVSPYEYTLEYESVGMIYITVVPGIKGSFEQTRTGSNTYVRMPEKISYDYLVLQAVMAAKKMGADALVDLNIEVRPRQYSENAKNKCWYEYEITGFCIKRKPLQIENK